LSAAKDPARSASCDSGIDDLKMARKNLRPEAVKRIKSQRAA
jgi:hypothetical protein